VVACVCNGPARQERSARIELRPEVAPDSCRFIGHDAARIRSKFVGGRALPARGSAS
jgi:hypothetical protein